MCMYSATLFSVHLSSPRHSWPVLDDLAGTATATAAPVATIFVLPWASRCLVLTRDGADENGQEHLP